MLNIVKFLADLYLIGWVFIGFLFLIATDEERRSFLRTIFDWKQPLLVTGVIFAMVLIFYAVGIVR